MSILRLSVLCAALLPGLWAGSSAARAEAPAPVAAELMRRAYERHAIGFDDAKLVLTMTLTRPGGVKKVRRIVSRSRKDQGLRKQHVCFLAPDELRNTAFLSVQQAGGRDDQYLWIPNQARLRRVSASQKSGSFMGTEFSYRDLEQRSVEDGVHTLRGAEQVGKFDTWVVETVARPGVEEEYGTIVSWVRKSDHFPVRTKFFDKAGAHVKTLFVREIGKLGTRLYAKRVRMVDLARKRSTHLTVEELDSSAPLGDELFTTAYLGRGQECAP